VRVSAFGSHNGEIAETGLVGKVYTSAQSLRTYSNSPHPQIWMSYGLDLTISVLFSKNAFEKWF
jgi:siderophore synthetase component